MGGTGGTTDDVVVLDNPEPPATVTVAPTPTDDILMDPPEFDAGASAPCDPADDSCTCPVFDFNIETRQSCAITLDPVTGADTLPVDAESFIEIMDTPFRVFALDRWGDGHIVAWCDGTTLDELVKQFPLFQYLAQNEQPRIASIGYDFFCGPSHVYNGEDYGFPEDEVSYLGTALPAEYLDDPERLAADYDGLLVCGNGVDWSVDFSATVRDFVTLQGRGVALVGEYASNGIDNGEEYLGLDGYALGSGITFEAVSLPWAPSSTEVVLDCVQDVPKLVAR
jgi:hypothetical protein